MKAGAAAPGFIAPPGLEPKAESKKNPEISLRAMPLLGSNQDSPDPEWVP
jgi:hypothetical protein